jgi:hypothetical protein
MGSSTSSFLYLPDAEKLADINKAGINLDVVERIVVEKKPNGENTFKQMINFIEDTSCRGCGEKVESQDLVVLDSVFYLWHSRCYQVTEEPAKEVGTYNEVSSRFGVFRRGTASHCSQTRHGACPPVPLNQDGFPTTL